MRPAPGPGTEAADTLVATRGEMIAQLLRGERERLSGQEREEVLRHRISYYSTDMVIATWSSALAYDTPAGASGVLEILEFANSQLLEFRYYDRQRADRQDRKRAQDRRRCVRGSGLRPDRGTARPRQWKASVREKLETVDAIYRFAIERTSMVRGEFLELVVVLLIVFEIILLMH